MKVRFLLLPWLIIFFGITNVHAAIVTIGKATVYGGPIKYNLIYDDDNNGKSLVWLDYSMPSENWNEQVEAVDRLNNAIRYEINPQYNINWESSVWRLPITVDGPYIYGKDGTTTDGYNIVTSEMGHLYYTELGNFGRYNLDGVRYDQGEPGLNNVGDFVNLMERIYWSGTATAFATDTPRAWAFNMGISMGEGAQGTFSQGSILMGLAVREGTVTTVPIPGSVFLFLSGIVGLTGINMRKTGYFLSDQDF